VAGLWGNWSKKGGKGSTPLEVLLVGGKRGRKTISSTGGGGTLLGGVGGGGAGCKKKNGEIIVWFEDIQRGGLLRPPLLGGCRALRQRRQSWKLPKGGHLFQGHANRTAGGKIRGEGPPATLPKGGNGKNERSQLRVVQKGSLHCNTPGFIRIN